MEPEEKQIERQTAKIVSIKEIINGNYVKQEGWDPNYILTTKNETVSRANIIGVVVTVPESGQSVFIDDGTGKIEARTFEDNGMFKNITIGDIIIIIGKPRSYNEEIYINAEIIRKISNKGWLEYRKKEINLKNILMPDIKKNINIEPEVIKQEDIEESSDEEIDKVDSILNKIKELDKGAGCDVSELIEIYADAENIVESLLLKGEIFEITPGKIKVLE